MKRAPILLCLFLALPASAQWLPAGDGVEYQHIRRDSLDAHVVRIDLTSPAVRVVATKESERGLTVSEFAQATNAMVAINADYFDEQLQPIGLAAGACGTWWRGAKIGRRQGLVGIGRRRAAIQANTMVVEPWMTGAVSGWPMLNRDCEPIADLPGSDHFTRAPHPRTAVGLSNDGRTMYFVVADGRRPGVPGPTLPELAQFMDELGACTAMNLDGGGSSAMWLADGIANQPSDGKERKVGNHLAVVAARHYKGCVRE
jgi:exopolysaccharide biosynthesis protein